jgi:hypothetical protein
MSEFTQIAERYIAMWNETDPATRRTIIEEVWSSNAQYIDPMASATGHQEIDATVAAVQAQFPDLVFRLASTVDAHHDLARFGWELGPMQGDALVAGFDVAQRGPDGRLGLVLGFLDKVPDAAA